MFSRERRLPRKALDLFLALHFALLLVSQFTGLCYTIGADGLYRRGAWYPLSYLPPAAILAENVYLLLRERERLTRSEKLAFWNYLAVPAMAMIVQMFLYGVNYILLSTIIAALAEQVAGYGDVLHELTGAVYDPEMPEALAKAGGLKEFLEKENEGGKTNYQLIADALGDEKKWFDKDLKVFNKVAETGFSLEKLGIEPDAEVRHPVEAPTKEDYDLVCSAIDSAAFGKIKADPSAALAAETLRVACYQMGAPKDKKFCTNIEVGGQTMSVEIENKEHAKTILNESMGTLWNLKRDDGKTLQQAMLEIKHKYGKNAVVKAKNLSKGGTAMERNQQIGGHKA